jgi:hypothetical protein
VPLGSSTVQLHDSLGIRRVCECSEDVSVVKLATELEECATEEQRSVVRFFFLWVRGLNAKDIYKEMLPVYGGKCLPHKAVHNWVEKFSHGRSKVTDDAGPIRPVVIATEAIVHPLERLI